MKKTNITRKSQGLSRTKLVNMINASNGKIMTITYRKTDGTIRNMNCNKPNGLTVTELGYILVNDMQETKKKKTKSVDPRTIMGLKFAGNSYHSTTR